MYVRYTEQIWYWFIIFISLLKYLCVANWNVVLMSKWGLVWVIEYKTVMFSVLLFGTRQALGLNCDTTMEWTVPAIMYKLR